MGKAVTFKPHTYHLENFGKKYVKKFVELKLWIINSSLGIEDRLHIHPKIILIFKKSKYIIVYPRSIKKEDDNPRQFWPCFFIRLDKSRNNIISVSATIQKRFMTKNSERSRTKLPASLCGHFPSRGSNCFQMYSSASFRAWWLRCWSSKDSSSTAALPYLWALVVKKQRAIVAKITEILAILKLNESFAWLQTQKFDWIEDEMWSGVWDESKHSKNRIKNNE